MKKNTLLFLLTAAFLSGCNFNLKSLNLFSKEKAQEENTRIESENSENSQEITQNNENTSGQNNANNNQNQQTVETEYSASISFYGDAFSSVATSQGVNIDTSLSSGGGNAEKLLNALKSQVKDESYLTSIDCIKLNSAVYQNVCYLCIGTGNPAKNNFSPGTFTWNSNKKIYKVDLTAQCYSKELGATDSSAHLKIDSQDCSLEVGESDTLEFKTFSKTYENGVNSFSLNSIGGRVLLKSLTITWRG